MLNFQWKILFHSMNEIVSQMLNEFKTTNGFERFNFFSIWIIKNAINKTNSDVHLHIRSRRNWIMKSEINPLDSIFWYVVYRFICANCLNQTSPTNCRSDHLHLYFFSTFCVYHRSGPHSIHLIILLQIDTPNASFIIRYFV